MHSLGAELIFLFAFQASCFPLMLSAAIILCGYCYSQTVMSSINSALWPILRNKLVAEVFIGWLVRLGTSPFLVDLQIYEYLLRKRCNDHKRLHILHFICLFVHGWVTDADDFDKIMLDKLHRHVWVLKHKSCGFSFCLFSGYNLKD